MSLTDYELKNDEVEMLKGIVGNAGKLIFAQRAGSWSFNMNTPTSDIDYFGVFIADDPLTNTSWVFNHSVTGNTGNDWVIYEISKFLEFLVIGNPKTVEPLFSKHFIYQTDEWISILPTLRSAIWNKSTIVQYLGFSNFELHSASKSMKNLENAQKTGKSLYHALRIAKETQRIRNGLEPMVWWETGSPDRDELWSIRTLKDPRSFEEISEYVKQKIDDASEPNSLPEKADLAPLKSMIRSIRSKNLNFIYQLKKSEVQSTFPIEPSDAIPEWLEPFFERSIKVIQSKTSLILDKIKFLYFCPIGSVSLSLRSGATVDISMYF